ncbi:hypothetical protein F5146DRAFT_181979 [Armillaria mellea]|nr:hypothetical protein F5146DRAFT_181979 [Armillaria mellea]
MIPVIVVGIVLGSEVAFLVFLGIFGCLLARCRNGGNTTADENIVLAPIVTSPLPQTSSLSLSPPPARTISINSTIKSLATDFLPRRLPQSSRDAYYEEEIERLRQEVLAQKNHIMYMHEQMELTRIGSPPPSYRSRRSDNSDYFGSYSSLSPRPPMLSPLIQSPGPALDRAYVV